MSGVSSWILSVCGIVIVSLLAEIILPSGKTNKLIKSVLALFSVLTIIYPLKQIDLKNLDFSNVFSMQLNINSQFVENRNLEKINAIEVQIEETLEYNGFLNVDIGISGYYEVEKLLIDNVFVDLKNSVLTDKNLNINKYTNIVTIIKKLINVKEESIIFYE